MQYASRASIIYELKNRKSRNMKTMKFFSIFAVALCAVSAFAIQATYIQKGDSIDYTPSAAVAAGDVIVQGSVVAVAKAPIEASTIGAVAVIGVFDVEKSTAAITAGAKIYWDADGSPYGGTVSNGCADATSTNDPVMGFAVEAAAISNTTVRVLLAR